jgi:protein-tyrosine phosphatase
MTQSHIDTLNYYHTDLPERVHLFREFMGKDDSPEIPDPYGQNYTAYAACFDSMAEAIPSLVAYLKNEYKI